MIPVQDATVEDWDPLSFWHEPWGVSGVHKGIDIFAPLGTPTLAATSGVVTYTGTKGLGGNVVLILGPKWRLHYYAHLDTITVSAGRPVRRGQRIGTVGDSGNAKGKPHHLHYVIRTPFPIPWLATSGTQGWKRMFFFDPVVRFRAWDAI
ncbi:MAG: M23 family metallopeptidase [Gammaproteobacteria bacterium]|nr:M23 family metallopeptidase [Gammaproteobacteria bacterium]